MNYGTALAAGGVQFAAMTWFARTLEGHTFSMLAWTFGLFPQYLLLIELGLQSELVRRFSSAQNDQERCILRAEATGARILIALISLCIFSLQAFLSGIDLTHAMATSIFLLSLIPAGRLLTLEAEGYGRGRVGQTLLMRLARLFGFVGCLGVHIFLLDRMSNFNPQQFFMICGAYPLVWFAVLTATAGTFHGKKNETRAKDEPIFNFKISALLRLLGSGKQYLLAFSFSWLANAIFTVGITRQMGEESLAGFFFAQTLCVPLALALQVVSSMNIAELSQAKNSLVARLTATWASLAAAAAFYGIAIIFTPIIDYLSGPEVARAAKAHIPWILPAHFAMALGGMMGVRLFAQGHKKILWISAFCSLPAFISLWVFFIVFPNARLRLPVGFDFMLTFSLPCLILFTASLFNLKHRSNLSGNARNP